LQFWAKHNAYNKAVGPHCIMWIEQYLCNVVGLGWSDVRASNGQVVVVYRRGFLRLHDNISWPTSRHARDIHGIFVLTLCLLTVGYVYPALFEPNLIDYCWAVSSLIGLHVYDLIIILYFLWLKLIVKLSPIHVTRQSSSEPSLILRFVLISSCTS